MALCATLLLATLLQGPLVGLLDAPTVRTGATVFVAICVQALPFLVLGTLLSGVLAAWVSPAVLRRVLPARPALAVPVAGAAGLVLPGCECASVPVARRLIGQGVPEAAALAFLLAAPAINPVVLVATAVAFPDHPEMVGARLLGSAATAVGVGWLWTRVGRPGWIPARLRRPPPDDGTPRWAVFSETVRHDVVDAGGFLVLGGLAAAAFTVLVPRSWVDGLAGARRPRRRRDGAARGAARPVQRGRRLRRRLPLRAAAAAATGLPGRRAGGRRQADRAAGGAPSGARSRCASRR